MTTNELEIKELSEQDKSYLINMIKATILILAGESTLQSQIKFLGKYMANAPKTGKIGVVHEFNYKDLFSLVFEKDTKQNWNTAQIFLDKELLTNFSEDIFLQMLQLNFSYTENALNDSYAYQWQLNNKVSVIFKVKPEQQTNNDYPTDFYQIVMFNNLG
ncbi:hypothetical protein MTZ49_15360 [Entomomonas sp. E2T0]|uniref:hypothetical protein n=1 Tax=Entomomonas sp. E2T0 TaxID=2930213 RepID=UPI0022281002|nr:hypothetical protein [Entomomonas sp. E2T0]UYZ83948.1 hypothetical protein MTZ49_15360 [Entomomonas sp. E2T0]